MGSDPGLDQIYPLDKPRETIDVDPELEPSQHEALYKVVKRNQATFRFNGRLGHYKTKVHIELILGTKPISVALYHGSPAKREVIDKQIDMSLKKAKALGELPSLSCIATTNLECALITEK